MAEPLYPLLYQVNTRVWLTELSRTLDLGRPATLDDIPDAELDGLARMGFDWVWFLSVWPTGLAGQQISRSNSEWRREFERTLPDLREEDVAGSGFAITSYTVPPRLGSDAALARLREQLRARGLRLMLDFVPNHTALDHPWVEHHPESAEPLRKPLADQARENVGPTAGRERYNPAHRPRRVGLCPRDARYRRQRRSARC
jgi:glycosidase